MGKKLTSKRYLHPAGDASIAVRGLDGALRHCGKKVARNGGILGALGECRGTRVSILEAREQGSTHGLGQALLVAQAPEILALQAQLRKVGVDGSMSPGEIAVGKRLLTTKWD